MKRGGGLLATDLERHGPLAHLVRVLLVGARTVLRSPPSLRLHTSFPIERRRGTCVGGRAAGCPCRREPSSPKSFGLATHAAASLIHGDSSLSFLPTTSECLRQMDAAASAAFKSGRQAWK